VLAQCILRVQGQTASVVRIPVGSGQPEKRIVVAEPSFQETHTAAILMELVLLLHAAGCALAPCHVPRELNQWADDLTYPLFGGFSKEFYLDVSGIFAQF
jgi:hypothetical protein